MMDGDRYERSTARHDRADQGVSGRDHGRCVFDHGGPGGAAPVRRHGAEPASILQTRQEPSGGALRLPAAADRLHPAAPDQVDRPVSAGASLAPGYAGQSDQLQQPLRPGRYRLACPARCPAQHPVWPGDQGLAAARLAVLRRRALCEVGGHLGLASLQSARQRWLPQTTHRLESNPPNPGQDRHPQSACTTRITGLHPHRHRASGRSGRPEGRLSRQRRRHRHPVGGGGGGGTNQ